MVDEVCMPLVFLALNHSSGMPRSPSNKLCNLKARYNRSMVEAKILTLIVLGNDSPSFLVLEPIEQHASTGKSRIVPICIGSKEAASLGAALENKRFTRPMTHDLMLDALTNLDARVDHVFIHSVKNGTFFAKLCLAQHDRIIELDARPSDAIPLAIRQDAPLYIDETVLEEASFPYLVRNPADEERVVDDFKAFLEDVSPEDFS